MPFDQPDREIIDAFHTYIEDSLTSDDRYGPPHRQDGDDGATLATHFQAGPSCWLTVTVCPKTAQVQVGFLSRDDETREVIEQTIQEADVAVEDFVGHGFAEAGLDWKHPPVEHNSEANDEQCPSYCCFATPLDVDELADLDSEEIRNKTLRMLEGYLIAFGPAIFIDEGEEEEAEQD